MTPEIRRGQVWTLGDGRDVLVVSLTGLDEAYGAVLAIVLHPAGRYPDTVMSVEIHEPLHRTAVAMNIQQLHVATRFKDAVLHGDVGPDAMARIGSALGAVLDL